MRTTIEIDDDMGRLLRDMAHRERTSFRAVVNAALRKGLHPTAEAAKGGRFRCPTFHLGGPVSTAIDLDKAMGLAAALEDAEAARKMELRK